MPVNSFENFPMSWKPNKAKLKPPLYLSIAEALEQDILNGEQIGRASCRERV